jgi:SAM-dependent methyltransferase
MNASINKPTSLNLIRIAKWEAIYKEQSKRWNDLPSKLAETTLKFIYNNNKIKGIADIGGGYGRDSIYFLKYEYSVSNVESSQSALALFEKDCRDNFSDKSLYIFNCDALELSSYNSVIVENDLVFCNYFLHLLSLDELNSFFQTLKQKFKTGTLISFNLISKKDFRYEGQHITEIESDIYWSFWDKENVINLISDLSMHILFWEEEIEIEHINNQLDKVYSHFIIAEIK